MSKSLGNFFTMREVLARFDPEVVRFFIVRAHYRSPVNYSNQHLEDARAGLARLYTALRDNPPASVEIDWQNPFAARFKEAMDDDFNTPEACAVLFELASETNRTRSSSDAGLLKALGGVLGLLGRPALEYLQGRACGFGRGATLHPWVPAQATLRPADELIDQKILARAEARKAKGLRRVRPDPR